MGKSGKIKGQQQIRIVKKEKRTEKGMGRGERVRKG